MVAFEWRSPTLQLEASLGKLRGSGGSRDLNAWRETVNARRETVFGTEVRFDGRVAVVTGAGRALGRAHAMLLAERGARVVVNDFGGGPDGAGGDTSVAHTVVAEIVDRGGEA